jgi:hypothetical protein
MYGYSDYNGPETSVDESTMPPQVDDEEDDDPLRSGLWMEGDSLAPPCGTSVSTIHKLLSFAQVSAKDILYDFGCGDGRICLEALVRHECAQCVGVEVEEDLVLRFQYLISKLFDSRDRIMAIHADLRQVLTALLKRAECGQNVSEHGSTEPCATSPTLSDLPMPTILVLYLLPEAIKEMECDLIQLLRLLPMFRIVCNTWGLPRLKASKTVQIEETIGGASTVFYLYTKESLP